MTRTTINAASYPGSCLTIFSESGTAYELSHTLVEVVLKLGESRVLAIKIVRDMTSMGLATAKDVVDFINDARSTPPRQYDASPTAHTRVYQTHNRN